MAYEEYLTKEGLDELVANLKAKYAKKSDVPTKTSELTNDSTFQTESDVTDAIAEAVSGITNFSYVIVQSLPASGEKGIIYLVPNASADSYDQFVWIESTSEFVKIGSEEIDLSGYLKTNKLVGDGTNVQVETSAQTGNTTISLSAEAVASLEKAEGALPASNVGTITNEYIQHLFD